MQKYTLKRRQIMDKEKKCHCDESCECGCNENNECKCENKEKEIKHYDEYIECLKKEIEKME